MEAALKTPVTSDQSDPGPAPLTIATDRVCGLVVRARQFAAKYAAPDTEDGSNAADDGMAGVLEFDSNDGIAIEIREYIAALDVDEQADLIALAWLGRDSGTREDWSGLRAEARERNTARTADYLMGMPLLADYLEEGLAVFGESCLDFEARDL